MKAVQSGLTTLTEFIDDYGQLRKTVRACVEQKMKLEKAQ
jgi:hypothetical protein